MLGGAFSDASKTNIATTNETNLTSFYMCAESRRTYSDAPKLNIATTTKPDFHYVCVEALLVMFSKPSIATTSKTNLTSLCTYVCSGGTYSDASKPNIAKSNIIDKFTSLCVCMEALLGMLQNLIFPQP